MKMILGLSLLMSSTCFAQSMDVSALKNLFLEKQASLEQVSAGMSKKLVTKSTIVLEVGSCDYIQTSVQTILKIEAAKMIVHSKETFTPANTPNCVNSGYIAYEDNIVFYDEKPSVTEDIADLEESSANIKSILRAGEIVTMNLSVDTENVTFKYDLSKPSFKNLINIKGSSFETNSTDLPNADVNAINLTNVYFCEENDGEFSDCVQGDYSDILF